MERQKILIVDDSDMNRALLADILEDKYEVSEAENGAQAVEILAENEKDFYFVLLDIMMPEMNGFDVLKYINKHYWNDRVVVMMISSDDSPENINRAYSLGAFDYIGRPFDPVIVRKRIANTLHLYARQNDLERTVKEQFYERDRNNDLMISILSHIVEFRNGESGLHIKHVKVITELLLRELVRVADKYDLSDAEISLISMASAIHDVGKISISEDILNKPGKLTEEEFEIMKMHTTIGAQMLSDLPIEQFDSPLAKVAYEICRWHHERFDGGGYPDGLKGDEIPIAAQVVAIADVYDALTSERCYKKAISHDEALNMIFDGKCGAFNPVLLRCLDNISERLKRAYGNIGSEQEERDRYIKEMSDFNGVRGKKHTVPLSHPEYMQLLYVDPLTKIYNRRYYRERIRDFFDIEAVALISLDNLGQINDTHGFATGDLVLRRIAQTLSTLVRTNDHIIRYGGNEFLVGFNSMTKSVFVSRLEKIIENIYMPEVEKYNVSISIVGLYGTKDPERLFEISESPAKYINGQVSVYFFDEQETKE